MSDATNSATAVARYDEVAEFYVAEVGDSVTDPGTAALLDLAGPVDGIRILDVACGQGRVARELARRGAAVTGLDLSAALLAQARAAERETTLGIAYIEGDVSTAGNGLTGPFDGVTCNYGLADIDDLGGALDAVARVLQPGAWFVLSLLHPCFPGWGADVSSAWPPNAGYFTEGWWRAGARSSRLRRLVGANHRTLSTYLNELAAHGLIIERVIEPLPPPDWLAERPLAPVPTFLAMRCVVPSTPVG